MDFEINSMKKRIKFNEFVNKRNKQDVVAVTDLDNMVNVSHLFEENKLPLYVQPKEAGVNLTEWVVAKKAWVNEKLKKYGGILFRGFEIDNREKLDYFLEKLEIPLADYHEGATPRTKLGKNIYTSTEFPKEQRIELHNELSYVQAWPKLIWFCSQTPAEAGGETPIADVRGVYRAIETKIVERFRQEHWMLIRNFVPGVGLSWQKTFRTEDKDEVAAYCEASDIEYEWIKGEHLRTRQVRPAIVKHPDTGELLWFNHILFWNIHNHPDAFQKALLEQYTMENLPFNTYYGDGTPIEEEVIRNLQQAYEQATVSFPWQKGDLLMLDNMLVAHGRNPFEGERCTLAAMGEVVKRDELPPID